MDFEQKFKPTRKKKQTNKTSYMLYYLTNHIFKPILPHHPLKFPDLVLECPASRYRM